MLRSKVECCCLAHSLTLSLSLPTMKLVQSLLVAAFGVSAVCAQSLAAATDTPLDTAMAATAVDMSGGTTAAMVTSASTATSDSMATEVVTETSTDIVTATVTETETAMSTTGDELPTLTSTVMETVFETVTPDSTGTDDTMGGTCAVLRDNAGDAPCSFVDSCHRLQKAGFGGMSCNRCVHVTRCALKHACASDACSISTMLWRW